MTETVMEIIRVIGSKIQEHLSFILLMMSIFLALRFVNVVIFMPFTVPSFLTLKDKFALKLGLISSEKLNSENTASSE